MGTSVEKTEARKLVSFCWRWLAEVPEIPGVLAYGSTRPEAIARAQALALRVIADRLEHGEPVPDLEK